MTTNCRNNVMGYLDYLVNAQKIDDEHPEYRLTMLQWHDSDDLKSISALQKELNVLQTKVMTYRTTRQLLTAIFTKPYGCYYEELTIEYGCWESKLIRDYWYNNPITELIIWNIPANADIRSERLEYVNTLTLVFASVLTAQEMMKMLLTLAFKGNKLILKNVQLSPSQLTYFKKRYSISYEVIV